MKKILLLLLHLFISFCYSQNVSEEISVPSPQSAVFSKFGDLNIQEANGHFLFDKNLFNYQAGDLTLPINLTYAGDGVKVTDMPTWTGMNWNLNAGGVITRTVRDLPDETFYPSYHYSQQDLVTVFMNEEGEFDLGGYEQFIRNEKNFDSESDIFHYNFSGYSGTFYLYKDENGFFRGKLLKYDEEIKIRVIGDFSAPNGFVDFNGHGPNNPHYEFEITLPNGTQYYFGGVTTSQTGFGNLEAVEETQLLSSNPLHQTLRVKTAFYLNKIENIKGDVIYFNYDTISSYNVFYKQNQVVTKVINSTNNNCETTINPVNQVNDVTLTNTVYKGKYLEKIWSPQSYYSVEFESSEVYFENNFKYKVLQKIKHGGIDVNLSYFPDFNTLSGGDTDKFFLTELNYENGSEITEEYSFEYQNLFDIPNVNSFSQDYLGYYNGVNNTSLLPREAYDFFGKYLKELFYDPNESSVYQWIYQNAKFDDYGYLLADRKPRFQKASNGVLNKINYPTGGSTVIEYEPIDKAPLYNDYSLNVVFDPGSSSQMLDQMLLSNYEFDSSGNYNYVDKPYLPNEQTVELKLTLIGEHPNGVHNLDYRDFVTLIITDMTTGEVFRENLHFDAGELMGSWETIFSDNRNLVYTFLKDHEYNLKIAFGDNYNGTDNYIVDPNTSLLSPKLIGKLNFNYLSDYDINEGLGIRVKRISDYTSESNEAQLIKRYYYGNMLKPDDKGEVSFRPLFYSFSLSSSSGTDPGSGNECSSIFTVLELNSQCINLYPKRDSNNMQQFKKTIISFGGDQFEKGGHEKVFLDLIETPQSLFNSVSISQSLYPAIALDFMVYDKARENTNTLDGLLIRERFWKNNNENNYLSLSLTKENNYSYNMNTFSKNPNMHYNFMYTVYGALTGASIAGYYMGYYYDNSYKPVLRSKVETDFLSDVSVADYFSINPSPYQQRDYSLFETISLRTDYLDNINNIYSGMPGHIKTTSSTGEVVEVKNYYPTAYFLDQLTNLTVDDLTAYGALETANRIAQPIYVESFKNTGKTSAVKYIYEQPDANLPFLLSKVQSAKEDQSLEDRIIYAKYDDNGNPVEVQKEKGVKVVYIWSESRKPLYKVVNSDYDTVMAALTASGITLGNGFSGATISANQTLINQSTLATAQVYCYRYNMYDLIVQMVQPNGNYMDYQYDAFNRLQNVKDKDGNILSENEIHYTSDN